tara:strand:+ start:107 stop:415 length:309 start_codon:yes stop_codon:yes gene_type:complete
MNKMLTITCTQIHHSPSGSGGGKKRCRKQKYKAVETVRVEQVRAQITEYKRAQKKIQMLTAWSLRSTQSSLTNLQEILETLEDLYGDEAQEILETLEDLYEV